MNSWTTYIGRHKPGGKKKKTSRVYSSFQDTVSTPHALLWSTSVLMGMIEALSTETGFEYQLQRRHSLVSLTQASH